MTLAIALTCLLAATPPADSIVVAIEANLTPQGALHGTLTATWSGKAAIDLRSRLAGSDAAARDRKLASMLPAAMGGQLKEFQDAAGSIRILHALDAPKFSHGAGASLEVSLPVYAPYELGRTPGPPLPLAIIQDMKLVLPAGMRPASFPSAFSTVTPDAGRYVLYFDVEGPPPGRLTARRELEITGTRLTELLEAVVAHDATRITLVPAPAKSRPGA